MTGWMPAIAAKNVRILVEVRDLVGSGSARAHVQVATTTKKDPGSITPIGAIVGSETKVVAASSNLDGSTGSSMWVRFGVTWQSLSANTYSQCEALITVTGGDQ